MEIIDEVKKLAAKSGKTLTYIAEYLTKHSGKKYTLKSLSNRLYAGTIRYSEMKLILEALNMKIKIIDKNEYEQLNDEFVG